MTAFEDELTRSMTETLVRVAAIEPPGYHGHGPLASTPVHLLRLGICNLACEWCEAPQTVAALGAHLDTTAPYIGMHELVKRLTSQCWPEGTIPLLITGGEPLLQDHAILDLAERLNHTGPIWVETNGTIAPPDWWGDYIRHTIVSPKVSTRDPMHRRLPEKPLLAWAAEAEAGVATFDFTCATRSDAMLATTLLHWLGLSPATATITPRGRGHDEQCTSLAAVHDYALEHGYRLTPRPRQLLTNPIEVHRRG